MAKMITDISEQGALLSASPEEVVSALRMEGFGIHINSSFQRISLRGVEEVNGRPTEFYADLRAGGRESKSCSGVISAFLDYDPIKDSKINDAFLFLDEFSTELSDKMGDGMHLNNPIVNLLRRGFRFGVSYDLQNPLGIRRDIRSLIDKVHSQGYGFAMSNSPERDAEIIRNIEEAGTSRR